MTLALATQSFLITNQNQLDLQAGFGWLQTNSTQSHSTQSYSSRQKYMQVNCIFDPLAYHDNLFTQLNIAFPATLACAVNKRKSEFLAGRYCAQKALFNLGLPPSTVGIGEMRSPSWPTGVKGSISHSSHYALAVVSLDSDILGIGVDIETTVTESVIEQTSAYILQQDEMKFLQHKSMTATQLFTIIFSLKESFFKAVFPLVKAYFDFDAVTVIDFNSDAQVVQFQLNYSLHEQLPKGMFFTGSYQRVKPLVNEALNTSLQDKLAQDSVVTLVNLNSR